jgi:heat shock protein HtpX
VVPVAWIPAVVLVLVVLLVSLVLSLPLPVPLAAGALPAAAWWLRVRSVVRSAFPEAVARLAPIDDTRDTARLDNVLDGLVLAMGVPRPELRVVDEATPVALALAGAESGAVIVLTTGLLEGLGRLEHEAIVALLLDRIRSGHARNVLVADALAGLPRLPLVAGLVRRSRDVLVPDGADVAIDLDAVRVTRFPPALADVLGRIRDHGAVCTHPALVALRSSWVAAPVAHDAAARGSLPSLVGRETALVDRIDMVKES